MLHNRQRIFRRAVCVAIEFSSIFARHSQQREAKNVSMKMFLSAFFCVRLIHHRHGVIYRKIASLIALWKISSISSHSLDAGFYGLRRKKLFSSSRRGAGKSFLHV
jgi:hypothetical protein